MLSLLLFQHTASTIPVGRIIVTLLVLSVVWWLFTTYILPRVVEPFKTFIVIVIVLAAIIWLLSLVGLVGPFTW